MVAEVLCGKVVSMPRKFAGRKSLLAGKVLVTRGPMAGERVSFTAPDELFGRLSLRVLVRIVGSFAGKTFVVKSVEDASRDLQPQDVAALGGYGGSGILPDHVALVLERAGLPSLFRLAKALADPAVAGAVIGAIEAALGPESAAGFLEALGGLVSDSEVMEVHDLFQAAGLGLDLPQAARAVDCLSRRAARRGMGVAELLCRFPWVLAQVFTEPKVDGLKMGDRLARHLGVTDDVARCIGHAIGEVVKETEKGHSYALAWRVKGVLRRSGFSDKDIEAAYETFSRKVPGRAGGSLVRDSRFVRAVAFEKGVDPDGPDGWKAGGEAKALYLPGVFHQERTAAARLALVLRAPGEVLDSGALKAEMAAWLARELPGSSYGGLQLSIADAVASSKVTVVTGLAGSGKTLALKGLVAALKAVTGVAPPVLAPTALAAQRAAERSGGDPSTVHRFAMVYGAEDLVDPAVAEPGDESMFPAAVAGSRFYPVVVVDEMSMMTVGVLAKLLWLCDPRTRFVLVGDPGQLPPVGPGGVFRGLIDLAGGGLPGMSLVELQVTVRTQGPLTQSALLVRHGAPLGASLAGVRLVAVGGEEEALEAVVAEVEALLRRGVPLEKIMVLAPTRAMDGGTDVLNSVLRGRLGRPAVFEYNGRQLGPGDPVVATRNDYRDGGIPRGLSPSQRRLWERLRNLRPERGSVYNGTRGVVAGVVDRGGEEFLLVDWDLPGAAGPVRAEYRRGEVPWLLEPAWALTVHKAQGGEAPHVVLVLLTHSWRRDLVYTGMTRCKGSEVTVIVPSRVLSEPGGPGAGNGPPGAVEGGGPDDLPAPFGSERSLFKWRVKEELGLLPVPGPVLVPAGHFWPGAASKTAVM